MSDNTNCMKKLEKKMAPEKQKGSRRLMYDKIINKCVELDETGVKFKKGYFSSNVSATKDGREYILDNVVNELNRLQDEEDIKTKNAGIEAAARKAASFAQAAKEAEERRLRVQPQPQLQPPLPRNPNELVEWSDREMNWVPCTNISPKKCQTRSSTEMKYTYSGGRKSHVKKNKKRKTKKYNIKK